MLTIADLSEFQGRPVMPAGQVVILRAHNGWRADFDFAANREAAHKAGCPAVGIYQYLPASVDPIVAVNDLTATIGKLADNEWLICDLEEGSGDQQARWRAWHDQALAVTKRPPWLYSGLAFAEAHDLDPDWLADYTTALPAGVPAHKLWQNTDAYPFPWGHSDASVFDGTLPEFLQAAGINLPSTPTAAPAAKPAAPPSTSPEGHAVSKLLILATGSPAGGVDPNSWWLLDLAAGKVTRSLVPADQAPLLNDVMPKLGLFFEQSCERVAAFPVA